MNNSILNKLALSRFRSSFKLGPKDIQYIEEKGYLKIKEHAQEFIKIRIASKDIVNDGKQTPMKGHPVFIAQHATATCCRKCIYKWHKIPESKELTEQEITYLVNVIMKWIKINSKIEEI